MGPNEVEWTPEALAEVDTLVKELRGEGDSRTADLLEAAVQNMLRVTGWYNQLRDEVYRKR